MKRCQLVASDPTPKEPSSSSVEAFLVFITVRPSHRRTLEGEVLLAGDDTASLAQEDEAVVVVELQRKTSAISVRIFPRIVMIMTMANDGGGRYDTVVVGQFNPAEVGVVGLLQAFNCISVVMLFSSFVEMKPYCSHHCVL